MSCPFADAPGNLSADPARAQGKAPVAKPFFPGEAALETQAN